MPFQNLFVLLLVISFLSIAGSTPPPATDWFHVALLLLIPLAYALVAAVALSRVKARASAYFRAEKRLALFAVAVFLFCLFQLDLTGYLHFASFGGRLPSMPEALGLGYFFLLLGLLWLRSRRLYDCVFQHHHSGPRFVLTKLRSNLPLVLPWLLLGLLLDLLALLPLPWLQAALESRHGDLFSLVLVVIFLVLAFPPLIRRLWGCTPLPPGEHRQMVEAFCRRLGFHSEILLWPLFDGQFLSAGVVGILPRLRYLLLTPALLQALSRPEIEAVLAHEIGHVKKLHIPLYIFLFLGLALLASALADPLLALLIASPLFFFFLERLGMEAETVVALLAALPMLALLLLYFRYVFGYFLRNFERQADLHAFVVQGGAGPLISAFERIAVLSGNIRDEPSWHHFSIAQRVDMLRRCEADPGAVRGQDRKLHLSLALYVVLLGGLIGGLSRMPTDLKPDTDRRYTELMLNRALEERPVEPRLHHALGDLLYDQGREDEARVAYERALIHGVDAPELRNNLAWLLLTARNQRLRDPERALVLARQAASQLEAGFILDTLAAALAANHDPSGAVAAEELAMEVDPENRLYYQEQIQALRPRP